MERIINITSGGASGNAGQTSYAAKLGLRALTRWLK
jgi:NAD(P)-dependent dehydrogenase (short-subunit alcohol dehydrogenase family)